MTDSVRTSTATILIITQTSRRPLVTVTSTVYKVNPTSRLLLTGSVSLQSSGTAIWSTNDTNIVMTSASQNPIIQSLPIGLSALLLGVDMIYWTPGTTLAFTLSSTGRPAPPPPHTHTHAHTLLLLLLLLLLSLTFTFFFSLSLSLSISLSLHLSI